MRQFYNLKVGTKLILSFIIVALISGSMGVFAIYNLKVLDNSDTELFENITVPLSEIGEISTEFHRIRVDTRDMIRAESPEEIQSIIDDFERRSDNIDRLCESYEKNITSVEVREEFKNLMQAKAYYKLETTKMINLAKQNMDDIAYMLFKEGGAAVKATNAEQEAISNIVALTVKAGEEKAISNTKQANRTIYIMIGVIAFVTLLSILIGVFISSLITRPLKRAVNMIEELSKGHLSERLNINTKDEIGHMAITMDNFANELQSNVILVMDKISNGDVSMDIIIKDENDEIAPALKKTVETIRELNIEIQRLIQAIQEGKLDTRGDADLYSGTWKDLITEINGLIDAFVEPINVTAEYVERISKGDIPPKITDTYYGDFNEIKNNINNCIDTMGGLIEETSMLITATQEGKLDLRGNSEAFAGDWAELIKGINNIIDAFVTPINITAEYMEKIGQGEIPTSITDTYYGDFNDIKNSINACIDGLGALVEGNDILRKMSVNDFTDHVMGEYLGIYDEIKKSINEVNDRVNRVIEIVSNVAVGDLSDLEIIFRNGGKRSENDNLVPALIMLIENIGSLVEETNILSASAIEGKLEKRGDLSKFKGEYGKVIEGINDTLDAIIAPVQEASSVLKEIAKGNLHVSMNGDYKGDHAELKDDLNETIEHLLSYVSEISSVLTEMGNGNLDLAITADYQGDFIEIKDSLNNIIINMSQVLGDINEAADQVASGSRQVSDGSQALSQGATEQASSIQELTASISEVASQTKQNAVNANQANELAIDARDKALLGNNHMKEMQNSMADINQSSANISKIIKVIDDIAFQTNILALNAAVEAARAGQHGKGFAVVAEEVRNLAARSADAAKDTTDLIEGSIDKAQIGTKIANDTASALNEIVIGIEKAASLVGNIAVASNEQASGIAQINKGIEQVSQVVQNNSATAEESAASSQELTSQAELLRGMVSNFKLSAARLSGGQTKLLGGGGSKIQYSKDKPKSAPRILLSNDEFDKY